VLKRLSGDFSLAVVDAPPSLSLWTQAALLAATDLLIPVAPNRYALEGCEAVRVAARRLRTGPEVPTRVAVTLYDGRISSHVRCEAEARSRFPVVATLPRASRVADNVIEGRPWRKDLSRNVREIYAAALRAILGEEREA
jgi:cellulose biosynthesis protein BcsQ